MLSSSIKVEKDLWNSVLYQIKWTLQRALIEAAKWEGHIFWISSLDFCQETKVPTGMKIQMTNLSGWNKFIWSFCKQGDKSMWHLLVLCIWNQMHSNCIPGVGRKKKKSHEGVKRKKKSANRSLNRFFYDYTSHKAFTVKLKVQEKWNDWTVGGIHLNNSDTSHYYGTGCTGSAIKSQQDNTNLPLSVISTFESGFCWTDHVIHQRSADYIE